MLINQSIDNFWTYLASISYGHYMKRISYCLNKQLADICLKSAELEKLTELVQIYLPEHLQAGCHVASFQKGNLYLTTEHASYATELRFLLPELRDRLRQEAKIYGLIAIKLQINIPPYKPTSIKTKTAERILPTTAQNIIQNTAQQCTYDPLKQALLSLGSKSTDDHTNPTAG